jgi:cytochrome c oxidase assembly protein subunit 15
MVAVWTPLAFAARRWTPSPRTLQLAALAAVLASVLIVVTGGAVRLTGSGLGCDTWPKCTDNSLIATPEQGIHGAIEFSNRMLTYVVCVAVGCAIVAVRCVKPRRRGLTRLAWSQFWLVVGNAVLGGVTVLAGLNPWTVAGHLLLALGLLTVTTLTWLRTREGDAAPRPRVPAPVRKLGWALIVSTSVLMAAGTIATGTGPHAGDSSDVPRMPFNWVATVHVHEVLAWIVCALAAAMWFALRVVDAPPDTRVIARNLLLILLAQGVVGYVQYLTDLPEVVVGVHMLGLTLVWIGVLRMFMCLRERPVAGPEIPAQSDVPLSAAV